MKLRRSHRAAFLFLGVAVLQRFWKRKPNPRRIPMKDTPSVEPEVVVEYDSLSEVVRELSLKRPYGLFYPQDFFDAISRADAEWFAEICDAERKRLGITLR